MDVCSDNIVHGDRTRMPPNRFIHPDDEKVCWGFYKDKQMDEEMERQGTVFKPLNKHCVCSGEEESDGESDGELFWFIFDDAEDSEAAHSEAAQEAPYVPPTSSSDEEIVSECDISESE